VRGEGLLGLGGLVVCGWDGSRHFCWIIDDFRRYVMSRESGDREKGNWIRYQMYIYPLQASQVAEVGRGLPSMAHPSALRGPFVISASLARRDQQSLILSQ